jgi:hypothetical protein
METSSPISKEAVDLTQGQEAATDLAIVRTSRAAIADSQHLLHEIAKGTKAVTPSGTVSRPTDLLWAKVVPTPHNTASWVGRLVGSRPTDARRPGSS